MHLWRGKESTRILSARECEPSLLCGHHCDHLSHRVSGHVCPEQPRKDTLWKHSVLSVSTTPLGSTQAGHRESTVRLQPTGVPSPARAATAEVPSSTAPHLWTLTS